VSEVFRDAFGVPHLRAASELDLAELQGLVTARDRAWQIESDRWRLEGRLSEFIGSAGLEWDRFAHRARLAQTAERVYDALDTGDRAWLDAYVRGVNAGLADGRTSPEFAELDRVPGERPAHTPWPSWAPIGVFLVAHVLFSNLPGVLWRAHVVTTLGHEHADRFDADGGPGSGSNAWLLAGSRTASGVPMLAGDPHRLLELPGVYQQVRLACPDYDVLGFAFPGVPGVQHFGHTGEAAWGITNAMAHGVDVFREELRSGPGGVEARGRNGWEPVDVRRTSIGVRGVDPVDVVSYETARGPVVVDDAAGAFSLRLPARVLADLQFGAFRRLLRARSAADVAAAFAGWVDPVNRVVAADRSGAALRFTAGRVPLRSPQARRFPLDAWAADADPGWQVLPDPEPVEGFAVDANERPARVGHQVGTAYAPPYRADRISELLAAMSPAETTADSMCDVLADTRLGTVAALLPWLDEAQLSPRAIAAAEELHRWNGDMDAGSTQAALFAGWRTALVQRLTAHPALTPLHAPHGMGELFAPWMSVAGRVADALPALLAAAELGIDGRVEAAAAFEEMLAPTGAAWGDTHRLHALHLLAEVPGATPPSVPPLRLSGDADCVRCTASAPGVTDASWRGSVARWVWDLSDRERSRWVVPFGASGDAGSAHFADQLPIWAAGETTSITTDWTQLVPEQTR
jgi:penicillin amidase